MFKNGTLACFLTEEEIHKFKEVLTRRESLLAEKRKWIEKMEALHAESNETWKQIRAAHNITSINLHLDKTNWAVLDVTEATYKESRRLVVAPLSEEDAQTLNEADVKIEQAIEQGIKAIDVLKKEKSEIWETMSVKYGFDNDLDLLLDLDTKEVFIDPKSIQRCLK